MECLFISVNKSDNKTSKSLVQIIKLSFAWDFIDYSIRPKKSQKHLISYNIFILCIKYFIDSRYRSKYLKN